MTGRLQGGPPEGVSAPVGWRSYHLVHHTPRDRLLLEVVRPVVQDLRQAGLLHRFFFVRYALGGPHVRLRLHCKLGSETETDLAVAEKAEEFFQRFPSTDSRSEQEVRKSNRAILANDPQGEDVAYPDNSWHRAPFVPEVERYGGAELMDLTFELFELSSSRVLEVLGELLEASRAQRLSVALRWHVEQAVYFARDREELLALVEHPVAIWGQGDGQIFTVRGREAFESQPESYLRLVDGVLRKDAGGPLQRGLTRLSRRLGHVSSDRRLQIAGSHLHMTANRLGLQNAEEVYIGSILASVLRCCRSEGAAFR